MSWLRLTKSPGEHPILVNMAHLDFVETSDDGGCGLFFDGEETPMLVDESFEHIARAVAFADLFGDEQALAVKAANVGAGDGGAS